MSLAVCLVGKYVGGWVVCVEGERGDGVHGDIVVVVSSAFVTPTRRGRCCDHTSPTAPNVNQRQRDRAWEEAALPDSFEHIHYRHQPPPEKKHRSKGRIHKKILRRRNIMPTITTDLVKHTGHMPPQMLCLLPAAAGACASCSCPKMTCRPEDKGPQPSDRL